MDEGHDGWGVLHLFYRVPRHGSPAKVLPVLRSAAEDGHQVVTVAMLGHRADLGVMALGPDVRRLRQLQTDLHKTGIELAYSHFSLTELSEYAAGLPEEMREARLHPRLPPEGKPAFCFYPMSKRRREHDNWYRLSYEDRLALMHGHGKVGRQFRGRVVQLITGSTGLDDWEWAVTLFGRDHDDLKDCVYEMRFDEASARYAEFGPFLSGLVGDPEQVLDGIGAA